MTDDRFVPMQNLLEYLPSLRNPSSRGDSRLFVTPGGQDLVFDLIPDVHVTATIGVNRVVTTFANLPSFSPRLIKFS
eukprot:scaffold18324_cov176-Amphora_coffeaeformis.AAC.7